MANCQPCNDLDTNCSPCKDCPPSPTPVMPRCDIALASGTFENATVVVDANGCISSVQEGRAPQYTPDICCVPVQGGGGGNDEPCDCPPGEPGANATITIGSTQSVDAGQPAKVTNVGTPTNAILNFEIPRGSEGGGGGGGGGGVTDSRGGIYIEDGLIVGLPATWPPVGLILAGTDRSDVVLNVSNPDPTTGVVNMQLNMAGFYQSVQTWTNNQIAAATAPLQNQINSLQSQLATINNTLASLQSQINSCCP